MEQYSYQIDDGLNIQPEPTSIEEILRTRLKKSIGNQLFLIINRLKEEGFKITELANELTDTVMETINTLEADMQKVQNHFDEQSISLSGGNPVS